MGRTISHLDAKPFRRVQLDNSVVDRSGNIRSWRAAPDTTPNVSWFGIGAYPKQSDPDKPAEGTTSDNRDKP
jgi:hypothetical protein